MERAWATVGDNEACATIETLDAEAIRAVIDQRFVAETRARALSPDHPMLRGSAQNPEVFFQNREAVNRFCRLTRCGAA